MANPPTLLTTKQASARSGISRRTLHRRVQSGELIPVQTLQMGRHGAYLFTVESIDELTVVRPIEAVSA